MQRTMTRAELAAAAEQALHEGFPHLTRNQRNDISERTIRFWTRERLLPPRGGPNRLGLYEPELIHRCVVIRRLRHEHGLALQEIRSVLNRMDDETLRSVAAGGELPALVRDALDASAPPPYDSAPPYDGDGAGRAMPPPVPAPGPAPTGELESREVPAHDDRPGALQALSDTEKAASIAAALREITGREYAVALFGVEYAPAGRCGSFGTPACIDCEIAPNARSGDREIAIEGLQQIADSALAAAVARELSARAGECYRGEILLKRYGRPATIPERKLPSSLRLAVLIAKSAGSQS